MKVYSTYLKILNKNKIGISITFIVFMVIMVLMSVNKEEEVSGFEESKVNITIINEDQENEFTKGLKEYLSPYVTFKELENKGETIQDALFFRETEYVILIPGGFYEDFITQGDMEIQKIAVAQSFSSVYMDNRINKYLNTWKHYKDSAPALSEKEISAYVKGDMEIETDVILNQKSLNANGKTLMTNYFNMACYSVLGVLIMAISSVMNVFSEKDLRRRNQCSPMKDGELNRKLVIGNFVFSLGLWALLIVVGMILIGKELFSREGFFMCINLFLFVMTSLSISIGITLFVKNKSAQHAAANTISLGMCFIGGAFVPQSLLGGTVKEIASFTPAYWYIRGNNELAQLELFSIENMRSIIFYMAIQIGFGLAIISASMFISKKKSYDS